MNPSFVLDVPPISRVCFNYYFNFMLAERHCQIVPFKGICYFGGLFTALYFWLNASQHILVSPKLSSAWYLPYCLGDL
jgi:hypothetical protein